jgi:hypothetical protein
MTAPSNELEAGRWLKATLEDGDDIKAYLDLIPEKADLPAYRYQVQRRNDVQTVAGHIVVSTLWFLVVATVQGEVIGSGPNGLVTLAENITNRLHLASGSTSKALIKACTREETYGNTENVGGDVIRHAGAIFKVVVQGTPSPE